MGKWKIVWFSLRHLVIFTSDNHYFWFVLNPHWETNFVSYSTTNYILKLSELVKSYRLFLSRKQYKGSKNENDKISNIYSCLNVLVGITVVFSAPLKCLINHILNFAIIVATLYWEFDIHVGSSAFLHLELLGNYLQGLSVTFGDTQILTNIIMSCLKFVCFWHTALLCFLFYLYIMLSIIKVTRKTCDCFHWCIVSNNDFGLYYIENNY